MSYIETLIANYKKAALSALFTLPLFVPLILVAIHPYFPSGLSGWLIVIVVPFIMEIPAIAFIRYIEIKKNEEGVNDYSISKVLKTLFIVAPLVIIAILSLVYYIEKYRGYFFEVQL